MDWVQWVTIILCVLVLLAGVSGALKEDSNNFGYQLFFMLLLLIPFLRVLGII